jgi:hypothetical protein
MVSFAPTVLLTKLRLWRLALKAHSLSLQMGTGEMAIFSLG